MKKNIIIGSILILVIATFVTVTTLINGRVEKLVDNELIKYSKDGGPKISYGSLNYNIAGLDLILRDIKIEKNDLHIDKLVIHRVDLTNDIPSFLKVSAYGVDLGSLIDLSVLEINKETKIDLNLDYEYFEDSSSLALKNFKIDINELGSLKLSLNAGGIKLSKNMFVNPVMLLPTLTISNAEITYVDSDLSNRLLTLYSKMYGTTEEDFKELLVSNLKSMEQIFHDNDYNREFYTSLIEIANNPKKFTISIEPSEPRKVATLIMQQNPSTLLELLNISIEI